MKIKICGISNIEELNALDSLGVDFTGIWWSIPKGGSNHSTASAKALFQYPTRNTTPVLVTLSKDLTATMDILSQAKIAAVQLHGFQPPGFVSKMKKAVGQRIKIFKVLHVQNDQCLEADFIDRYLTAGTDWFILDRFDSNEKIGSTGQVLNMDTVRRLSDKIPIEKIMLAGGIGHDNVSKIIGQIQPYGIDVDSSVKSYGKIDIQKVADLLAQVNRH